MVQKWVPQKESLFYLKDFENFNLLKEARDLYHLPELDSTSQQWVFLE
jgi:hypothetical protein